MNNSDRPLSPHLSVYRWPITMALSILHRATGMANALGLFLLAGWLFAVASGESAYLRFGAVMSSVAGQALLLGLSFSFFYHLMNGIRHLFWDAGFGFEKATANVSAWAVLTAATLTTVLFWVAVS